MSGTIVTSVVNSVSGLLKSGKGVAEVFVENKEARGARSHEEVMAYADVDKAIISQFAEEFKNSAKTGWGSFIDGLNKLPRPLLVLTTIGFFVYAPINPPKFLEIATAYSLMPTGFWMLLGTVFTFYFTGRMQLKSQDFAVSKQAMEAAKTLLVEREVAKSNIKRLALTKALDQNDINLDAKDPLTKIFKGATMLSQTENKVIETLKQQS